MRISYISDSIIPSRFANSIHVMKMCQAFSQNGHKVQLYARAKRGFSNDIYRDYQVEPNFEIKGLKYSPIKKVGYLYYFYSVISDIKKNPMPDIFYSRLPYVLAAIASTGVPMIYESHVPPSNLIRAKIENRLFTQNNFHRLVVISKALKNIYYKIFPWLPEHKIIVAHDGADMPGVDDPIEKNFILDNQKINVGYTGHLYPGRGIELIASLANDLPHINFHIVGGLEKDILKWEKKYKSKNLYIHGFVNHTHVNYFLKIFDIVLAPYQKKVYIYNKKLETSRWFSPMKVFEYMAAGKPIVASNIPVLREVLNENNAILVEPEDIDAWKNAILFLFDEQKRFELGSNAKKAFEKNYTWDIRAKKVLK